MNSNISINNFNINPLKMKNVSNARQGHSCAISKDVFQKSNISFKGSNKEDDDIQIYAAREGLLLGLIDTCSKMPDLRKVISNSLNCAEQVNIFKFFINDVQKKVPDKEWGYIINLLNETNITTFRQLDAFIQSYRKDKTSAKVFDYQNIAALEIYKELDDKSDLKNFPELLLNLYFANKDGDEDKKIDYNVILNFLKKIDVRSQDEFDTKFSYLKSEFNNFEKIDDKRRAITSVMRNYCEKTDFLETITQQNSKLASEKPEKIYAQINDIVDYFYKINNGESLDGIDDILELTLTQGKFKKTSLDKISPYFNNFEDVADKIQFFKLLNSNSVSIPEFNNLAGNSIISDADILENIGNKKRYTTRIAQFDGENENSAEKLYSNFKDLINAVCQDAAKTNDNLKLLLKVIKENKISNSASMLNFYLKMTGKRPKTLTKAEFSEFIELFNYQVDNLQEIAKKKKVAPIELLKQEKAAFEKVREDIEIAKKSGPVIFASQSSVDIYNGYKKIILESDDVVQTVKQIAMFGIEKTDDFKGKMQEVEKFRKFFNNDEDLVKFIEVNSIKFDGSKTEEKFIENCLEIFNFILDSNDKKYEEKLNYFAHSGFLINSQERLEELLEKTDKPHTRREVIATIADKKIPSIDELEKFINRFKLPNSNGEKIFKYIKDLRGDCDFKKATDTLNRLCVLITENSLPLQINENNIKAINPNSYNNLQNRQETLLKLFNSIFKSNKKCNFLRGMSNAEKTSLEKFSEYDIAWELANNIEKSDESYRNITELLQIDRKSLGLNERNSTRDYARAIRPLIDRKLVNLINSEEMFESVTYNNTIPNVSLHARLRLLDRFILPETKVIFDLDKPEIHEKIKKLYETIFTLDPYEIEGLQNSKRIETYFDNGEQKFKVIFSPTGEMITITPPKESKFMHL